MPSVSDGREEQKSQVYDLYGKNILECNAPLSAAADGLTCSNSYDVNPTIKQCLEKVGNVYNPAIKNIVANIEKYTDSQQFIRFIQKSAEYHYISSFLDEIIKEEPDYNLAKKLYIPIISYDCQMISNFRSELEQASFTNQSAKKNLSYFLELLENLVSNDAMEVINFMAYKTYEVDVPISTSRLSISLPLSANTNKLKLYVLNGNSGTIQTDIYHEGEKSILTFENQASRFQSFQIDLSQYKEVTNISLETSADYIALVPDGATFQATSYNTDGTIRCRFDQTGNAEFYTYDDAGRVIRVEDQYGKVVREYEYNQLINE